MSHPALAPLGRSPARVLLLTALLFLGATAATATAPSRGASSASGVAVNVAAGPARVLVGPYPQVGGSAPSAYHQQRSAVQVDASSNAFGIVAHTGVLEVHVDSDAPGGNGAAAQSTVHD